MRTVLMIGPVTPQTGGMERYLKDLLNSPLALKFNIIHLDISKKRSGHFQSRIYEGYSASFKRNIVISLKSYLLSCWFFIKFLGILIIHKIHLVHIHTASYTSFWDKSGYILVAKSLHIPVVLHIHGALFKQFYENASKNIQYFICFLLKQCDTLVLLGKYLQPVFNEFVSPEKMIIVYNGIDLSILPVTGIEKFAVPTGLFVGELSRRKGIYDLLKAIEILHKRNFECEFYITGYGESELVYKKVQKLGLADIIHLTGPLTGNAKYELFEKSWLLVLPSYAEGMPMTIIEAFAYSLPVISTSVGAIPEMIEEHFNGTLCAPGRVEQIAESIAAYLQNRQLLEETGRRNKIIAQTIYNIEKTAQTLSMVYQKLLNGAE